jgi:preprotein translocase subunit YajC
MTGLATIATTLLTQQPAAGTKAPAGPRPAAEPGGGFWGWAPFLAPLLLLYFMLIRPQQRQEQVRKQMLAALKRNDRVLTSAGIYGTIVQIDPESDKVVLRVDDDKGLKLTFSRASIVRRVDSQGTEESSTATTTPAAKS